MSRVHPNRSLFPFRVGAVRLVVAAALVAAAGAAAAGEPAQGVEIFHLCGTCHGAAGEGSLERRAPKLAGLPTWYVDAQLKKFESGIRAYHADDVEGLQMKPMARYVSFDERRDAVVEYIGTLTPTASPATVAGDIERGKLAFAVCQACHGTKAEGNETLKAPALAQQADWYLVAQIKKFRDGIRGAHKDDTAAAGMRAMAMTLPTDQAIDDVVVYIRSLGE